LQICNEILSALASNGPMTLRKISERLDIKETLLKKHLKLLQDSPLVLKENFGKNKIFFTITESGLRLLKILTDTHSIQTSDFKKVTIIH
jgi:predicted ArsR family transcriptional regulator